MKRSPVSVLKLESDSIRVFAMAWSPDGRSIVTGSSDKILRIWDAELGTVRRMFAGHSGEIRNVAWSHDGETIASSNNTIGANKDGLVYLWEIETIEPATFLQGNELAVIRDLAWCHADRYVAGASGHSIYIWDVTKGGNPATLNGHEGFVNSVSWSLDDKFLASCGFDRTIRIWNTETKNIHSIKEGHSSVVSEVSWSPNTQTLVSSGRDGTVRVWNLDDEKPTRVFKDATASVEESVITSVAWASNGRFIAAGDVRKTIKIFNADTLHVTSMIANLRDRVSKIALSPDNKQIVVKYFVIPIEIYTIARWSTSNNHAFHHRVKKIIFQLLCIQHIFLSDFRVRFGHNADLWLSLFVTVSVL